MKHLFPLLILILAAGIAPAAAQTATQRGVARMITRSLSDPVKPVRGVSIVVGNSASKGSDAQGRFTLNIVKNKVGSFQLTDVKLPKNSTLILASPSKKKTLFLSQDELAITFTTPEDQKAVSRTTYQRLKKQYDKQAQELIALRTQLENQQTALQNNAAASAQLKARIDSIQSIINDYFDEKKRDYMLKELQRIADELALTDYQSLDSLERRIYDLRQAGEWQTISTLLHTLMHGNAAAWLSALASRADRAERDFQFGMDRLKDAIEAFKMQHLNDSVAHYYEILTRADSTNFDNLFYAGVFERDYIARYDYSRAYFDKALRCAKVDSAQVATYLQLGLLCLRQSKYNESEEFLNKSLTLSAQGSQSTYTAAAYGYLGLLFRTKGDYARAEEALQKSLDILQVVDDEKDQLLSSAYLNLGEVCSVRGDYVRAEAYLKKALEQFVTTDGEQSLSVAVVYDALGQLYANMGDYAHAEELFLKAIEIQKCILGEHHPYVAVTYSNLAGIYQAQCQYGRAEEQYKRSLEIQREVLGDRHHSVFITYNNLGSLYESWGNYSHAEKCYKQALEIGTSLLGKDNIDVATTYTNLSIFYNGQGKFKQAEEYAQQALTIRINALGEQHKDVASAYNNLALVYSQQGQYERARELYQKALSILVMTVGEENLDVATTYSNLSSTLIALGGKAEHQGYGYSTQTEQCYSIAEQYLNKALSIEHKVVGEKNSKVAVTYNALGNLYLHLALRYGRADYLYQAMEAFQKAIDIQLDVLGSKQHIDLAKTYGNYALCAYYAGNYATAEAYFQKAYDIQKASVGERNQLTQTCRSYLNAAGYRNAAQSQETLNSFMATHAVVAIIREQSSYLQQVQSERFYLLAYNDWDIENNAGDVFALQLQLRQLPQALVLYQDGEIREERFENQAGVQLQVEELTESEKAKLVEAWRKYKATKRE